MASALLSCEPLICAYCFNDIRAAAGICPWCGEAPKALPPVRIRKPPIQSAAPRTDPAGFPDVILPRTFLWLWGFGIGILGLLAFEWLPAVTFVTLGYAGLAIFSSVFVAREAWAWRTSMVVLAAPLVLITGGALLAAGELRGEGCGCVLLILIVAGVMTLVPMGALWKIRP